MRYAVYMKDIEGSINSSICNNRAERDISIGYIKCDDYITDAAYYPIYASGEYVKNLK